MKQRLLCSNMCLFMLPVGLQGADRYNPAPLPRSHNPGERSHVQTRRQRERLQSKFCHTETSQLTINNTYTTSTMTIYYCLFLILSRGDGRYFLLCYLHCNTCVRYGRCYAITNCANYTWHH